MRDCQADGGEGEPQKKQGGGGSNTNILSDSPLRSLAYKLIQTVSKVGRWTGKVTGGGSIDG